MECFPQLSRLEVANVIPVAARRLAKEVVVAIFVAIPPSNSLANFTMVDDNRQSGNRRGKEDTLNVDTRYLEKSSLFSGGNQQN